jgi:hypothetical protein
MKWFAIMVILYNMCYTLENPPNPLFKGEQEVCSTFALQWRAVNLLYTRIYRSPLKRGLGGFSASSKKCYLNYPRNEPFPNYRGRTI